MTAIDCVAGCSDFVKKSEIGRDVRPPIPFPAALSPPVAVVNELLEGAWKIYQQEQCTILAFSFASEKVPTAS